LPISGRPQRAQRLTPMRGALTPKMLAIPRQNLPGATAFEIMPTSTIAPRNMMTAFTIAA